MQAPNPAAPDAGSLQALVSAIPSYKELVSKLSATTRALSTLGERRSTLHDERSRALAAAKSREAALLVEHAGSTPEEPDPLLATFQLAAQSARDKLSALSDEDSKLRALAAALQAEQVARDGRLRQIAFEQCCAHWKGKANASLMEAREALAKAIIAWCAERTMRPEPVDVGGFFNSVIDAGEVARLMKAMAEAEHTRARNALVKERPELGD